MPGKPARPIFSAIGATQASAREQILALGPNVYPGLSPSVGDVLVWNGTAWIPTSGIVPGQGLSGGIIFRPGGTPSNGVVTTETALQNAVSAFAGPTTVLFDDSVSSPIHLTQPWSVSYGMRWVGKHIGSTTNLVLDDGFVLTGPGGLLGISYIGDGLSVRAQGISGPVPLSLNSAVDVLEVDWQSRIFSAGVSPLIQVEAGNRLILLLRGRVGDGTNPVVSFASASQMTCFVDQFGQVESSSLLGGFVNASVDFGIVSTVLGGVSTSNPDFSGTTTTTLLADSEYQSYDDLLVNPPLNASNVQDAIDAIKGFLITGGGSNAIWRGAGAPIAPGVYNTWASLYAWIQAAPGSKRVYLDSTFGPLEVDSGLWVFTGPVEFVGSPTGPRTEIVLNESSFRNAFRWSRLKFTQLNTVGVPFGTASDTIEFDDCEVDLSGGGQPFIRTLTATMDVTFNHMEVYPTTQLMFDMQPSAPACTIRLLNGSSVNLNSFSSAVGTTLTVVQDTTSTYLTQFFVFGTLIRQLANPPYIAGDPSDWTGSAPDSVFEALDRLAVEGGGSASAFYNDGDVEPSFEILSRSSVPVDTNQLALDAVKVILLPQGPFEIYVSAINGSDSNDGLTPSTPLATLIEAETRLPDTITRTTTIHVGRADLVNSASYAPPTFRPRRLLASLVISGDGASQTGSAGDRFVTLIPPFVGGAGTNEFQVVTSGLTPNSLKGRTVRVLTGMGQHAHRTIASNTATTIVPLRKFEGTPVPGDSFEVVGSAIRIGIPDVANSGEFTLVNGNGSPETTPSTRGETPRFVMMNFRPVPLSPVGAVGFSVRNSNVVLLGWDQESTTTIQIRNEGSSILFGLNGVDATRPIGYYIPSPSFWSGGYTALLGWGAAFCGADASSALQTFNGGVVDGYLISDRGISIRENVTYNIRGGRFITQNATVPCTISNTARGFIISEASLPTSFESATTVTCGLRVLDNAKAGVAFVSFNVPTSGASAIRAEMNGVIEWAGGFTNIAVGGYGMLAAWGGSIYGSAVFSGISGSLGEGSVDNHSGISLSTGLLLSGDMAIGSGRIMRY